MLEIDVGQNAGNAGLTAMITTISNARKNPTAIIADRTCKNFIIGYQTMATK